MDDFLIRLIAHVEQQRLIAERECSILTKLLRPWPKKKQRSQEKSDQDVKQKEEHLKDNDGLTPDEKLALQQMDLLLGKAQKALKIKEKMMVVERTSAPDLEVENLSDTKKDVEICGANCRLTNMEECKDNAENKSTDSCNKHNVNRREKKKEMPSVKRSQTIQRNRVAGSMKSASDCKSGNHAPSQNISKSVSPRPSSALSSRPSSSKSRYTPAHLNAPFKTETNTKVPHRRLNHMYKNHINKSANKKPSSSNVRKQPSLSNGLKKLPKIIPVAKETENFPNDNNGSKIINNSRSDVEQVEEIISVSEFTNSVAQNTVEISNAVIHNQPKYFSQVEEQTDTLTNSQISVSESVYNSTEKEEALFSLKDKSSKLKIPTKLQKLVAENCALLEKCSTAKLVKKMPNVDAGENFVQRLNEYNTVSPEVWARAKSMSCLQMHRLMLDSLHSLNIEAIMEKTPFETVYKAKQMLEFILSKFAETQDEADYFTKVQFKPLQPKSTGLVSSESSDNNSDNVNNLFVNYGTESDKYLSNALKRSKEWTQLQFKKHLYELHIHLLDLSETEWWQLITQQTENDSVVQMVHSLLTSSGEFFPAIIENPYS